MALKLSFYVGILLICWSQAGAQQQIERVNTTQISQDQLAKIQDGVREALKEEPFQLGALVGGNDNRGALHVCGWLISKGSVDPFFGLMTENRFVIIRHGSSPASAEATLLGCRLRGLAL